MAEEFTTGASITATLDEGSLRDARDTLEDELASDPITVDVSQNGGGRAMTDGGRGMSALRETTESLVTYAEERNDILGQMLEAVETQAFETAQGGGGGGPLEALGLSKLAGSAGGAAGGGGLLAGVGKALSGAGGKVPGIGGGTGIGTPVVAPQIAQSLDDLGRTLGGGDGGILPDALSLDGGGGGGGGGSGIPSGGQVPTTMLGPSPQQLQSFTESMESFEFPEFSWPDVPDPFAGLNTDNWPDAPDPLAALEPDNWPDPPDPLAALKPDNWPDPPDPLGALGPDNWPDPPDPLQGIQWPDPPDVFGGLEWPDPPDPFAGFEWPQPPDLGVDLNVDLNAQALARDIESELNSLRDEIRRNLGG